MVLQYNTENISTPPTINFQMTIFQNSLWRMLTYSVLLLG